MFRNVNDTWIDIAFVRLFVRPCVRESFQSINGARAPKPFLFPSSNFDYNYYDDDYTTTTQSDRLCIVLGSFACSGQKLELER